jgi:predicted DNA-binding transcriptional regulator AlpA
MTTLPTTLHPEQRLSLSEVETLTGRKKTKLYELIAKGHFPAPERDGPRWSRWRAGSVLAWLESQSQKAAA